jgi:hypothetical protein
MNEPTSPSGTTNIGMCLPLSTDKREQARKSRSVAASAYAGSGGSVAVATRPEASAAFAAFTSHELPTFRKLYPDLQQADLERLIGFKWSKLDAREKDSWSGRSPASSNGSSSWSTPAVASVPSSAKKVR